VVTAERVWEALAEIPDPEIPPISIVDLGVVRDVSIENGTVHVEFTPTFLGCPALEVMRDQMAARIRELGAEPEIEVILDDSWSTDRITPEGREKLRLSGFARARRSSARTAGRPRRASRTSLAPRRAARSATARAAASPSSSSKPSNP
jgi:ring-1,2-phenylacetyl-CoA epoxidase subunit PaaD